MATLENRNVLQCSGRVIFKDWEPERKRLFFVVGMTRRVPVRGTEPKTVRDSLAFAVEGEKAEEFAKTLEESEFVDVTGRVGAETEFRHESGSMYKQVWGTTATAEAVAAKTDRRSRNQVTLAGRVIRVYRNADAGKRFYMITIRTTNPDGSRGRASFTYFDRDMKLEPKNDDFVTMTGLIQSRKVDEEYLADMNGRRRRQGYSLSIVARRAELLGEDGEPIAPKETERGERGNGGRGRSSGRPSEPGGDAMARAAGMPRAERPRRPERRNAEERRETKAEKPVQEQPQDDYDDFI